jgi:uncharacterized protein YjbI with pentapeptide repeats
MPFFTKTIRKFFCLVFFTTILTSPFFCFSVIQEEPFKIPVPILAQFPPHAQITPEEYEKALQSTPLIKLQGTLRSQGIDLKKILFNHSLVGIILTNATLPKKMEGVILDLTKLENIDWSESKWKLTRFIGATLDNGKFSNATIEAVDFYRASILKGMFDKGAIRCSRFRETSLQGASFKDITFHGCQLIDCNTEGVSFSNCTFIKCMISPSLLNFLKTVESVRLEDCTVVP